MYVIGIDASGPANHDGTAMCVLDAREGGLRYVSHARGLGDRDIVDEVAPLREAAPVVVGIDAPLSYGDRGGDRPGDKALRAAIQGAGLSGGSVMAPTSPRMAYLTLRGVGLSRALLFAGGDLRVVEVHPGAALVLGGAAVAEVRRVKADAGSRAAVVGWLGSVGVEQLPAEIAATDHEVMAAAAAWAAWRWATGRPSWSWPASPPCHPFDFAC